MSLLVVCSRWIQRKTVQSGPAAVDVLWGISSMKAPPELFGTCPSVPPNLTGPGPCLRSVLMMGKGDGVHGSKLVTVEPASNDLDQVIVPAWTDNNRRVARMLDGGSL